MISISFTVKNYDNLIKCVGNLMFGCSLWPDFSLTKDKHNQHVWTIKFNKPNPDIKDLYYYEIIYHSIEYYDGQVI